MKRAISALRPHRAASNPSAAAAEVRLRPPRPPRGQHLLANARVLDDIVRRAGIRPGDAVLEVGPGTGNLTARLLASPAASVTAVEIEPRMSRAVTARAAALGLAHKLTVITGDAMKAEFPQFDACVGNIPYGISSPLVAKLLFGPHQFRTATLVVQREFARRLAAAPGDREFNRLAENARLVADVRVLAEVSRADFVPVPGVDSALVEIVPKAVRPSEVAPGVPTDEWLAFVSFCFEQHNRRNKRKQEKTIGTVFKRDELVMEMLRRSTSAEECDSGVGAVHGDKDGVVQSRSSDGMIGFGKEEVVAFKERIPEVLRKFRPPQFYGSSGLLRPRLEAPRG
ncbi:hypothetical protein PR202_gb20920 [Eleusine coracana subsp. coracana]|uniref:rRNA adenine N(6)-methyltransferase n=1 Tax=Eleusine coracana subsp. coracana TaxID=191504 RepID=A0AAV5FBW1_ELECO|nr:hypothetical protein QOZ80_7BG0600010 [Eleusine coracana subsp. coracana]GJN32411.1 hypothetical protein PR202_gb20920 [Eleusine coracana subsp. coracana]